MSSRWLTIALLTAGAAFADDDVKVSQQAVADSDTPYNVAEGVVDAPVADLWTIVSHCADFAKYMPRIVKSAELSRVGDENSTFTTRCDVTAHLPFPLPDLTGITQAVHTVQPGVKYTREWNLVSGDYHINTGSWTLLPIDGGKKTYAIYKIRVKPKINLPSSWIASAQKGALKDVILRMRENMAKKK